MVKVSILFNILKSSFNDKVSKQSNILAYILILVLFFYVKVFDEELCAPLETPALVFLVLGSARNPAENGLTNFVMLRPNERAVVPMVYEKVNFLIFLPNERDKKKIIIIYIWIYPCPINSY